MELMEECSACKVLLVYREEEDKLFLACPNCGFKKQYNSWTPRACQKCGCEKAIITFYGVIIGDEQPLTLYKCVRCGTVEREGIS